MRNYRPRYRGIRFATDIKTKQLIKKAWDEGMECRNSMWRAIGEADRARKALLDLVYTKGVDDDPDAKAAHAIFKKATEQIKELFRITDKATDMIDILERRYRN